MGTKTKKKPARKNEGKRGGGRPSDFNEAKNTEVFKRIVEGGENGSLRKVLKDLDYVHISSFLRWAVDPDPFFDEFREQYRQAREIWAHAMAHDSLDIVDENPKKRIMVKDGDESVEIEEVDPAAVNRNRIRAEHRRWIIGRVLARFYGEKTQIEHGVSEKLADLILESKGELPKDKS